MSMCRNSVVIFFETCTSRVLIGRPVYVYPLPAHCVCLGSVVVTYYSRFVVAGAVSAGPLQLLLATTPASAVGAARPLLLARTPASAVGATMADATTLFSECACGITVGMGQSCEPELVDDQVTQVVPRHA